MATAVRIFVCHKLYLIFIMVKNKQFPESVRHSIKNLYSFGKQLGMAKSTICSLLQRGTATIRKRGGTRQQRVKINRNHLEAIERWMEETPDITLRNLSTNLLATFNLDVSPQCIAKHIEGMCYSLKKCRIETEGVNNAVNKEKRKCYAEKYMEMIGNGYIAIFEDETNFNIHCKRSDGRGKVGARVNLKMTNTRGPNLHCIGAVSSSSLVFFETRRGSLKSDDFQHYISGIVNNAIDKGLRKFVIIVDNAPAHCKVEDQLQSTLSTINATAYDDIQLLRLAPYSFNLNPIQKFLVGFQKQGKEHNAAMARGNSQRSPSKWGVNIKF